MCKRERNLGDEHPRHSTAFTKMICSPIHLIVTTILFLSAGCGTRNDVVTLLKIEGETMGTRYVVKIVTQAGKETATDVRHQVETLLEAVNTTMSNYRTDSEISRFNRLQSQVPFPLSDEMFVVIREALAVSKFTNGAFDVTVSPLVRLWGFGLKARPQYLPNDEAIERVSNHVGFGHLRLDESSQILTKNVNKVECDLSGIAKGYAVDQVAELLKASGLHDFMVEIGGEVRTSGFNEEGVKWRIAIERPHPISRSIQRIVHLSQQSMATSGDYRNFYEVGGKTYSHMIDPRDGRPVEHELASVSVISKSCMRADALASGLLVLGLEAGLPLARKKGIAALFLVHDDDGNIVEYASPVFKANF